MQDAPVALQITKFIRAIRIFGSIGFLILGLMLGAAGCYQLFHTNADPGGLAKNSQMLIDPTRYPTPTPLPGKPI